MPGWVLPVSQHCSPTNYVYRVYLKVAAGRDRWVGAWVRGCVGARACGRVGAWVRGCVSMVFFGVLVGGWVGWWVGGRVGRRVCVSVGTCLCGLACVRACVLCVGMGGWLCVCVRVCMRMCVRACVRACLRACGVDGCGCRCVGVSLWVKCSLFKHTSNITAWSQCLIYKLIANTRSTITPQQWSLKHTLTYFYTWRRWSMYRSPYTCVRCHFWSDCSRDRRRQHTSHCTT